MPTTYFAIQSDDLRPRDGARATRVIRASHLGMCFGVRDAIRKVVHASDREPLTVLGDLVHNEQVLRQLAARGISVCRELDDVQTRSLAITAHGVSDRRRAAIRQRGLTVVDATCPLVRAAHRAVLALARDGFHVVIVGARDHVEVRGLTEDLEAFDVVLNAEDVASLAPRPSFGIAAQTTQPIERVRELAALIRRRFPGAAVRVAETVCVPTRLRQEAAVALAQQCDLVIVVGGARSNNSRELSATCARHCRRVHLVQGARDLQASWFDGTRVAGLTAGTSTPEDVIDAVEARMREIAEGGMFQWA